MKIAIIDTYYADVLKSFPIDESLGYEENLARLLDVQFGTFYAYSKNLRALGHECIDIVANASALQELWAKKHLGWYAGDRLEAQMHDYSPDVVFMQDLSLVNPCGPKGSQPKGMERPLLAAQCSCAFDPEKARQFDVIFTSLPMHIPIIESLGVNAVYLPLAFEPSVLEGPQPERDIDISFVGGVGRNSHWRSGTDTLEAVAAAFPDRFQWYGYGLENLPAESALRACYRGTAWGRDMYLIYRRSKIVINRHGEIACGYANNLRCFEASGCGAALLTEGALNLNNFFTDDEVLWYHTPEQAVEEIEYWLMDTPAREAIAAAGQARTLRDHTYAQRMNVVSDVLTAMLAEREVSA